MSVGRIGRNRMDGKSGEIGGSRKNWKRLGKEREERGRIGRDWEGMREIGQGYCSGSARVIRFFPDFLPIFLLFPLFPFSAASVVSYSAQT